MRTPFGVRAQEMGLSYNAMKQMATYGDQYSDVIYRQMVTMSGEEDTDSTVIPIQAIFTRGSNNPQGEFIYCGYVSDFYQFMGNDVLNQRVRDAVQEVGMPIMRENPILSFDYTRMRNEMIIQSSQQVPNAGDILPVMIVENSYNGTKAATMSFGIATHVNDERVIFGFSLGQLRQVHIVNSGTEMASAVSSYMQVFTNSISEMITQSFNSTLTPEQMLGTLDMIEKIGKKRREEVSEFLSEMTPPTIEGQEPPMPSAWQMFLAIVRYSSFEPNLNIKRLLENAAESVLVIPPRMFEVLEELQSS